MQNVPQGNLILFGEMHGSVESPELIYQVACSLSKSQAVVVGLEIPSEDQPLIDSYLASRGAKSDQESLTSSSFWQNGTDGRSSVAMLKLIEDDRALGNEGVPVTLVAFDDQPSSGLDRDAAIAKGIRRIRAAHPEAKVVALMGNLHAMSEPMQLDGRELTPSGSLLEDLRPTSVLIAYPAGTTWACMPICEVQTLEAVQVAEGPSGFRTGVAIRGYTHTYVLASITASPPAVHGGNSG